MARAVVLILESTGRLRAGHADRGAEVAAGPRVREALRLNALGEQAPLLARRRRALGPLRRVLDGDGRRPEVGVGLEDRRLQLCRGPPAPLQVEGRVATHALPVLAAVLVERLEDPFLARDLRRRWGRGLR